MCYMFSALSASSWLANPVNRTSDAEFVIYMFFAVANAAFLVIGIITILDIHFTMKREYEKIKKKLDETVPTD